jgi:toxin ParE1/3/4
MPTTIPRDPPGHLLTLGGTAPDLYAWIAAASTPDIAERFVVSIMGRCDRLADFPIVGAARDDIRPGLRTLGYRRRAVIAFAVTETTIEIIGIHYGGRDIDAILAADDA